jgi:hypothetical protein
LLFGFAAAGFLLMILAAAVFMGCGVVVVQRQPSLETATLLAGAATWLAGNVMLFEGRAAVPWWIAFFALTIGGERLELSRYLKRAPWVRRGLQFCGLLCRRLWFEGAGVVLPLRWAVALTRRHYPPGPPAALRCRLPARGLFLARAGRRADRACHGLRRRAARVFRRLRLLNGIRSRASDPARGSQNAVSLPPRALPPPCSSISLAVCVLSMPLGAWGTPRSCFVPASSPVTMFDHRQRPRRAPVACSCWDYQSRAPEPRKLVVAAPHTTVAEAANLMKKGNAGAVLVVDDGRPVGIFTERDVLFRASRPPEPAKTRVT